MTSEPEKGFSDVEDIKKAISAMTDDDYEQIRQFVMYDERDRRRQEAAMADTIDVLRQSGVLDAPKTAVIEPDKGLAVADVPAWVDPGTVHSRMYTGGAVVKHKKRIWLSEHRGLNHWEPGADGVDERIWRDITDEVTGKAAGDTDAVTPGAAQDGVIPFKPGLDLKAGDVVEFRGAQYRVLQPHTSASNWTPPEVPALFQKL